MLTIKPTTYDHDRDAYYDVRFESVRDAALYLLAEVHEPRGARTGVLCCLRAAHKSGLPIASVCRRACKYVSRFDDYTDADKASEIATICDYCSRVARIYGELPRNRRFAWDND